MTRQEILDEAKNQVSEIDNEECDVNKKQKVADWKLFQRGNFIDIRCSHCFNTRVEAYAYNYHIYELTVKDKKEIMKFIEDNHMNYCECCGLKMRYKI